MMADKTVFELREMMVLNEAPPHVERDEVVRHLIKHKLPIKRRESSKISDSEYIHVDVGDHVDEYGDKIGDKLIKVRFSDHRATRHAIQKHGAAHVEIGPHGHSVQRGMKEILRHAGINEAHKPHINYFSLSNYSLGQRVRYGDQFAALEIARRQRANFQQHKPQPLIQSKAETEQNPTAMGKRTEWVRDKIDVMAQQYNYPREKIYMSDDTYTFQLNGRNCKAGGLAFLYDNEEKGRKAGDIVMYGHPDFNVDLPIRGILAHEIMHQKFHMVMEEWKREVFQWAADHDRPVSFRQKVAPADRNKYPVMAALHSTAIVTDGKKLAEDDGVSNYSSEYWAEFYRGGEYSQEKFNSAVHETLAEIARLDEENGLARKMKPEKLYTELDKFLKDHFTERFRKDGNRFAEPEEYQSIMSDPFAYFEMADSYDLQRKLGIASHKQVRVDHIRKQAIYEPSYFNTPHKIKPSWLKLYDVIEKQYERLTK
jgi:hypothetical protein